MLASGWERWPLQAVCSVLTDGSHYSPTPQTTGKPIANVKDMRDGYIDLQSCTKIPRRDFEALKRNGCEVRPGDVLFSKDGTIGKVVTYDQKDELVVLSSIAILRPSTSIAPKFLGQALKSPEFTRQVAAAASGSAIRRLVLREISSLVVPIPPMPQQRRIAEILDTADRAIEETETLISKLKRMTSGLMHDLLTRGLDERGRLRDRDAQSEQFRDSPLGRIPIDWEVTRFERLAQAIDPQPDHRAPMEVPDGEPYIGVGDFNADGSINFAKCRRVSLAALRKQQRNFTIQTGDILFGKIGTIGQPRALLKGEYALNANTVLVKPKIASSFVFWLLHSALIERQIQQQTHSTSQPAFGIQKIRAMSVPVPDTAEQQRIAEVLDTHGARIRAEEAYRDKLKLHKRGLMDDLLTGRVRVKIGQEVGG